VNPLSCPLGQARAVGLERSKVAYLLPCSTKEWRTLSYVSNNESFDSHKNMTDDITLGLGTYALSFKDKDGSERRVTGLAPALACKLSIKSQPYVDSATKVAGTRTVVRIDRNLLLETGGAIAPLSAYLVLAIPAGSLITTSNIGEIVDEFTRLLGSGIATGSQLNKGQAIFVNQEK
jgi:hypothetical protein